MPDIEIRIPELAELRATVDRLYAAIDGLHAPAQNGRRYLNAEDAAAYLGIAVPTLRKWTCAQRIRHVRLSTNCVKYDVRDLDAWMERKKAGRWPEKS